MKRLLLSMSLLLSAVLGMAQEKIPVLAEDYDNYAIQMADAFRAEGKIYVVVAVVLVIFVVMAVYLIRLDRRASRMEAELKELKELRKEKDLAL